MSRPILPFAATFLAALFLGAILAGAVLSPASAGHQPADKMAVAGATLEVTQPGEVTEILGGTMRTSSPTDVIISLSLECSIITQVVTVGDDASEAEARVVAWVEIDGVPVGVNSDDDGEVVFCDRTHRQQTSLFDDDDATIDTYLATRSSHAFQWIALNLGSGVHTFSVKTLLTETTSDDDAFADAVIGKRTLVVEPTKLANDINI